MCRAWSWQVKPSSSWKESLTCLTVMGYPPFSKLILFLFRLFGATSSMQLSVLLFLFILLVRSVLLIMTVFCFLPGWGTSTSRTWRAIFYGPGKVVWNHLHYSRNIGIFTWFFSTSSFYSMRYPVWLIHKDLLIEGLVIYDLSIIYIFLFRISKVDLCYCVGSWHYFSFKWQSV